MWKNCSFIHLWMRLFTGFSRHFSPNRGVTLNYAYVDALRIGTNSVKIDFRIHRKGKKNENIKNFFILCWEWIHCNIWWYPFIWHKILNIIFIICLMVYQILWIKNFLFDLDVVLYHLEGEVLINKAPIFFLKRFFGGDTSLFWSHWYPCFGLLVTSAKGFKARHQIWY